jgi:hypothetical protein
MGRFQMYPLMAAFVGAITGVLTSNIPGALLAGRGHGQPQPSRTAQPDRL